jgi:hypothetical protein
MPAWENAVERWRDTVRLELDRQKCPLPEDLILSVIHVESRGYPGHTNPKSGASGLMQVMPKTLSWYNAQTGSSILLDHLRSPDYPTEQIRVGIWVLGQFWRSAHQYLSARLTDVPVDELGKIADLFYVAGPGAAKKRLDKLEIPFFSYAEAAYPKWNALPHPKNVWKVLPANIVWPTAEIAGWLKKKISGIKKTKTNSIILLMVLGAGYWWLMKGKKNVKGKKN